MLAFLSMSSNMSSLLQVKLELKKTLFALKKEKEEEKDKMKRNKINNK
jgi:hypothetical protein